MLRKTHKTALVAIPPYEIWPPIQAIRRKYDKQFRRWMPHITLVYPFRPKGEFAILAEQFISLCDEAEPFRVELGNFSFFEHRRQNYTIWLSPDPREPLVYLQKALLRIVPDCNDVNQFTSGFVPHLSIGQVRGKAKLKKIRQELQQNWQPLSFVAREISLIWRDDPPEDIFRVAQKVKLRG